MTPVTDQNLISQLEGSGNGQPITDPALIAQLEGTSQPNSNLMNAAQFASGVTGMPAGVGLGALNSLTNFANDVARIPSAIAPKIFPQGQIPQIASNQNIPGFGTGKFIGNIIPFAAGGEALDTARAALGASKLPVASQIANWLGGSKFLPSLTNQAIGAGTYGAIADPQNPGEGAAKGAGISAGLSLIPGVGGQIAKGINYLKPGDYADQIINQLSNGQSLEQSGKNLASSIKNTFDNKSAFASNNYFNPVLNQVGNQSIYSHLPELPTGIGGTYRADQGLYESIPQESKALFNGKVKTLNNNFTNNPTFSNAHQLQQQLGNEIGGLQYKAKVSKLDANEQNLLENYSNARDALKDDMSNFLDNTSSSLSNLWQNGIDFYRNEIVPFYADSTIRAMAKGKETNPTLSDISNSFKNPNPDIQMVVNSLPDQAKNSLLYAKLGTENASKSADSLVKYSDKLDEQGMGSYKPQSFEDQINSLRTRIKARNVAQGAAGAGLAFSLLHPFSHLLSPEIVGAATLGSGVLGPMLSRMGQRMLPDTTMPSLSQSLLNSYPALRASVIPNAVGGQ